jgi:hypothetical protein
MTVFDGTDEDKINLESDKTLVPTPLDVSYTLNKFVLMISYSRNFAFSPSFIVKFAWFQTHAPDAPSKSDVGRFCSSLLAYTGSSNVFEVPNRWDTVCFPSHGQNLGTTCKVTYSSCDKISSFRHHVYNSTVCMTRFELRGLPEVSLKQVLLCPSSCPCTLLL